MLSRMVTTRAPLRICFAGTSTDLPFYYRNSDFGQMVSAAINKFIYVTVNKKFDQKIRLSYSRTEIVDSIDKIKHPTVREALRLLDIDGGIEIVSISDIPSQGTGLGSSSSFLVSLLHALHSFKGELVGPEQLAKEAVHIEREVLGEPGGKQDQYMAAYGNVDLLSFYPDERVDVEQLVAEDHNLKNIEESMLLLYTGRQRTSSDIIVDQSATSEEKRSVYDSMKSLAPRAFKAMSEGDIVSLGEIITEDWSLKRSLSAKISDSWLDDMHAKALEHGALGGEIVGAGGGGFLLLIAEPAKQQKITNALGLNRIDFKFHFTGSRIIFVGE